MTRPHRRLTAWLTTLALLLSARVVGAQTPCGTYSVLYSESASQIQTDIFNPANYVGFAATYTGGDDCSVAFFREDVHLGTYGPLSPSGGSHHTQSSSGAINDGEVDFRWEYFCGFGTQSQTCDSITRSVNVEHYDATIDVGDPVPIYDSQGKFVNLRFPWTVTGHCAPGNPYYVGFRLAYRIDDGEWIGIPEESSPASYNVVCEGSTSDKWWTFSAAEPGPHAITFRVYPLQSVPRYPFPTDEVTVPFDVCNYLDNDGDGVGGCEDCDDNNPNITGREDLGECTCPAVPRVGEPISPVSGQMTHTISLFTGDGAAPLTLHYDSTQELDRGVGVGWRTSWDAVFDAVRGTVTYPDQPRVLLTTPDNHVLAFTGGPGAWIPPPGSDLQLTSLPADQYELHWPDGRTRLYGLSDSTAVTYRLLEERDRLGNTTALTYDALGHLDTATNAFGRSLHFTYAGGRLTSVSDDTGATYQLTYDATYPGRLTHVGLVGVGDPGWTMTYAVRSIDPGGVFRPRYRPLLVRLDDPRGQQEARWDYDTKGRAILGEGPGGMEAVHPAYNADGTRVVTDSLGNTSTYAIVETHDGSGDLLSTEVSIDGCLSCGGADQTRTFDGAHRLTSRTDANGVATTYAAFNPWGSPGIEVRAAGTPEAQTITTTYHPLYDLPTSRTVAGPLGPVVTTWDFDDPANDPDPATPNSQPTALIYRQLVQGQTLDAAGQPVPFTHVTTHTYNAFGQKLSEDGPLVGAADTPRWAYCDAVADEPAAAFGWDPAIECPAGTNNGQGNGTLLAVTNPTGQVTRYGGYDAAGRVGYVLDANGHRTDFTYDAYGRLNAATRQFDGAVTDYDHDPLGNLSALHLPEGNTVTYTYDAGRRLTRITDDLGNYLQYTYDSESHRTKEAVFDASGVLQRYEDYAYDDPADPTDDPDLLWKTTHPDATTVTNTYDPAGNRTATTDENGHATTYAYDALGRLTQVTQPPPQPGDPNPVTTYGYDSLGNLATVTDANGHATVYAYDDAGHLLSTTSPDTGVTTYRYDAAGNLTEKTDAAGVTVTYDYDAAGRLTAVHYPDVAYDQTFTYDEAASTNGAGRLTSVSDATGTTRLHYDGAGRLSREEHSLAGVPFTTEYAYDGNGNRTAITYPSGRGVATPVDGADRLAAVTTTVDGAPTDLLAGLSYQPFGPLTAATYGNGLPVTSTYDPRYRLTSLTHGTGVVDRAYVPDPVGNVSSITSSLSVDPTQTFTYDALSRLTGADQPAGYRSLGYAYDPVGNRTAVNGDPYTYEPGTNRLASTPGGAYQTSAAGNITQTPLRTFTYDPAGRLATAAGATYGYDYRGLRVAKTVAGVTTLYHYDADGRLLAETDATGFTLNEVLWAGDQPVAVVHGDPDGDGVAADGDGSGSPGDAPCSGGETTGCDDNCPAIANPGQADTDGDGVGDACDTCTLVANPGQTDTDSDGFGNACDGDFNQDGAVNSQDQAQMRDAQGQAVTAATCPCDAGSPLTCPCEELDLDGVGAVIDNADMSYFRDLRGNPPGPGAPPGTGAPPDPLTFVHSDHLGTPVALTDPAGQVVWRATKKPFGTTTVDDDPDGDGRPLTLNLRFPGQYFDAETGMHYNWHRYYEPHIGRYVTPDPLGLEGNNNLYVYVNNEPLRDIDPTGESLAAAGAAAGVAVTVGVVTIVVKCIKDCTDENPCDDLSDPERHKNCNKCLDRCIQFTKFLGFNSRAAIMKKIAEKTGSCIGKSSSK